MAEECRRPISKNRRTAMIDETPRSIADLAVRRPVRRELATRAPLNCGPERDIPRDQAIFVEYLVPLVSGKVLCGGQQTLSIQCRGGNLSGKRFELRAAENWAGAPPPRFSTMRDAHRPVRFLRVDRPSPSPGVSEMRGPLRRSSSARSEEHTSELQSPCNLVCRLLLEK